MGNFNFWGGGCGVAYPAALLGRIRYVLLFNLLFCEAIALLTIKERITEFMIV